MHLAQATDLRLRRLWSDTLLRDDAIDGRRLRPANVSAGPLHLFAENIERAAVSCDRGARRTRRDLICQHIDAVLQIIGNRTVSPRTPHIGAGSHDLAHALPGHANAATERQAHSCAAHGSFKPRPGSSLGITEPADCTVASTNSGALSDAARDSGGGRYCCNRTGDSRLRGRCYRPARRPECADAASNARRKTTDRRGNRVLLIDVAVSRALISQRLVIRRTAKTESVLRSRRPGRKFIEERPHKSPPRQRSDGIVDAHPNATLRILLGDEVVSPILQSALAGRTFKLADIGAHRIDVAIEVDPAWGKAARLRLR